jgi:hypothetical protein
MSTLTFFGDGTSTRFGLPTSAVVSGVTVAGSGASFTRTSDGITLSPAPANGATVVVTYSEVSQPAATQVVLDRNAVDQTGLTAGGNNKVNFTNKVSDPNGWYDAVTNFRFTPTVAGWYLAHVSVQTLAGTSGETAQAQITKNGTVVATGTYLVRSGLTAGTEAFTSTATLAVFLNGTTDYIEFSAYLPAACTTVKGTVAATRAHVTSMS